MKRIKFGFLIAIVALALTATAGAGTASASKFVTSGESSVLTVTPGGAGATPLNARWFNTDCWNINAEGTVAGERLASLTAAIGGSGFCEIFGEAPVKPNGCTFVYHPGAEESPKHFGGTFDIGPSNCGPMTIGYGVGSFCNISVYPKSGLPAHYTNVGEGTTSEVTFSPGEYGLKAEGTGSWCAGTTEGLYFSGSWQLAASVFKEKAGQRSLSVVEHPPLGFYATSGTFNAEEYPAAITGSGYIEFGTEKGWWECGGAGFYAASLTAASSSLALSSPLTGCTGVGNPATLRANGCEYALSVSNTEAPYTGTEQLTCPSGKSLELDAKVGGTTLCTLSEPAQTLGTTSYTSGGTNSGRYLTAKQKGEGLEYSISGGSGKCGKEGTHKDGKLAGSIKLTAKEA